MAENRLGLSIDPRSIGIAKTTTQRASDITLVTGSGGVQGGMDSIAATPTNAAPLAIAVALISLVKSFDENTVLMIYLGDLDDNLRGTAGHASNS
jgi:hypothetical protein